MDSLFNGFINGSRAIFIRRLGFVAGNNSGGIFRTALEIPIERSSISLLTHNDTLARNASELENARRPIASALHFAWKPCRVSVEFQIKVWAYICQSEDNISSDEEKSGLLDPLSWPSRIGAPSKAISCECGSFRSIRWQYFHFVTGLSPALADIYHKDR
jgi:hypothetical protein